MIPLATTTFTQRRPNPDADPYEAATSAVVARGIRGHLSAPTGAELAIGGQQSRVNAVALLDTTCLEHTDELVDDNTGLIYRIEWTRTRQGLSLDHSKAGLVAFEGAAARG